MRSIISTLCILLVPILLFAQPDTLWTAHFGGTNEEICRALVETSGGGFALLGSTQSFGAGGRDYYLVRTDTLGHELWNRTYGGSGDDVGYALQQTRNGGFICAGRSNSLPGGYNAWIVRTNGNGDTLWTRKVGGSQRDECYGVVETLDSGFVCAGYTASYGRGGDFWLFKLNARGDSLWSRTYGGSGIDMCYALLPTADGGFLLGGQTQSYGQNADSAPNDWIVHTAANGDSLWSRVFGGSSGDACTALCSGPDGGYYLGGYTSSFGAGREDAWLIRVAANGDSLWGRAFGGTGSDYCAAVLTDSSGNGVFAGWKNGTGGDNYWLSGADPSGGLRWESSIGGNSPDQCNAALRGADGVYALAGSSFSFSHGNQDFWLVKTRGGVPRLEVTPDPLNFGLIAAGAIATDSIRVHNIGDVSVTIFAVTWPLGFHVAFPGQHLLAPNEMEWYTVTFNPDTVGPFSGTLCVHSNATEGHPCIELAGVGIQPDTAPEHPELPLQFSLAAYPNPFNPSTQLEFVLPEAGPVRLTIFDAMGREAAALLKNDFTRGIHRITFEGSHLPSGLYFARLTTASAAVTTKLVLLK
jgi:hypothetical protein